MADSGFTLHGIPIEFDDELPEDSWYLWKQDASDEEVEQLRQLGIEFKRLKLVEKKE